MCRCGSAFSVDMHPLMLMMLPLKHHEHQDDSDA